MECEESMQNVKQMTKGMPMHNELSAVNLLLISLSLSAGGNDRVEPNACEIAHYIPNSSIVN